MIHRKDGARPVFTIKTIIETGHAPSLHKKNDKMSDEKFQNKYRIPSARAAWHDYGGGAYFVTICTKNREHSFGEIHPHNKRRDGACPVSNDNNNFSDTVCHVSNDNNNFSDTACPVSDDNNNSSDTACPVSNDNNNSTDGERPVSDDNNNFSDGARPVSTPTMRFTPVGQFLYDNLDNVSTHYPYVEIPLFVVMPNHWHAIVFIDGEKTPYPRRTNAGDDTKPVETGRAPSPTHVNIQTGQGNVATGQGNIETGQGNVETEHGNIETGHAPSLQIEKMRETDALKGWLSIVLGGIKSAVTKFANKNNIEFEWQERFHDKIIRDKKQLYLIAEYIENNAARWDKDCFK